MVEDLCDCLKWIKQNIQSYGGDPNRIHGIGHSSGAHVIAMYLVKQAFHFSGKTHLLRTYKHIQWDDSVSLQNFIGLCGVYEINDHYLFETNRGKI